MLTGSLRCYPTPDQIMTPPISFKEGTVELVHRWKDAEFVGWEEKTKEEKLASLEKLVKKLASSYGESVIVRRNGERYRFLLSSNVIEFDSEHPSIISALHEFRHRLNGPDEVSACRWSVQLFARCFPEAFARLQFKPGSHLLVKRTP